MKIQELLNSPEKWCKAAYAKDAHGHSVNWNDPTAVQWCLGAALYHCYTNDEIMRIFSKLIDTIGCGVVEWNDNPKREFGEVADLIAKLDI